MNATSHHRSQLTSAALVGAPVLLGVYGVVRLLDGRHGPGPGWITGHAFLLAGLLLFAPVFLGLHRLAARRSRIGAGLALGTSLVGLAASLGQVSIDLYVGSHAVDLADQDRMFGQIQSHPGVLPVFYSLCPLFFYLGLLALLVIAAIGRARTVSVWSPVLVLVGTVLMGASLDLMPVGAVLFLVAFTLPVRGTRPAAVSAPAAV
ncbi:hypothetical protein GCM10009760_01990 [Kitasatospora kazusensis]|uniref:Uncharacterized protein n=1 Tax=Kitasatospora kazusensis TaxID=407974 RepID=A0ABP5KBE8_9ACTN